MFSCLKSLRILKGKGEWNLKLCWRNFVHFLLGLIKQDKALDNFILISLLEQEAWKKSNEKIILLE